MFEQIDYRMFYNDEDYLLKVGREFRTTRKLDPADFYMLLVWKANRAKNYHRDRLKKIAGTFSAAVQEIATDLSARNEPKAKLQVLMDKWLFAIPTASAILSLLYPEQFTVYDVLVCGELKHGYKPWRSFSDKLWEDYQAYKEAVITETPAEFSLRDKDRYLIGRAYRESVKIDSMA